MRFSSSTAKKRAVSDIAGTLQLGIGLHAVSGRHGWQAYRLGDGEYRVEWVTLDEPVETNVFSDARSAAHKVVELMERLSSQ